MSPRRGQVSEICTNLKRYETLPANDDYMIDYSRLSRTHPRLSGRKEEPVWLCKQQEEEDIARRETHTLPLMERKETTHRFPSCIMKTRLEGK